MECQAYSQMMEVIAYTFGCVSIIPFQGMTSNWSYFSFIAIEWNLLFDEVNEPSYAMDEFMLVKEEHIVTNRYEEQQDERSALPSSYSIKPAVRSFFLDKLFYFSSLTLVTSSYFTKL